MQKTLTSTLAGTPEAGTPTPGRFPRRTLRSHPPDPAGQPWDGCCLVGFKDNHIDPKKRQAWSG